MTNKNSESNPISLPKKPSKKNKTIRFLRFAYQKLHLDKNIWNFILISMMFSAVFNVLKNSDSSTVEGQANLLNTAAIVGAAGALLWTANGIHNQYHDNLLSRASYYVKAWRSDELFEATQVIREVTREEFESIYDSRPDSLEEKNLTPILSMKYDENNEGLFLKLSESQNKIAAKILGNKDKMELIEKVLDFLDQMGQDVKFHVVDSEYIKDSFYTVVIRYYELLRKYIEYWQNLYDNRLLWCNFVYLAQTWEKEAYAPRVPRICLRDSIVGPKVCQEIEDLINDAEPVKENA